MKESSRIDFKAMIYGGLIGGMVGAANVAFGLKTNFTVGTSIITAVLVFAVFKLFHRHAQLTPQMNLLAATAGSSAGYMASTACLVSAIPALEMLGTTLDMGTLMIWALSVSTLGVVFAIPLRKRMIVTEQLPFPTGVAAAETIRALHAGTGDKKENVARVFLIGAAISALIFAWMNISWIPWRPPDKFLLPLTVGGVSLSAVTIGFSLSPMLVGAGAILGVRTGWSLILGALLYWGVLVPHLRGAGYLKDAAVKTAREFGVWPGVAVLVVSGLTSFLFGSGVVKRVFVSLWGNKGRVEETSVAGIDVEGDVPRRYFFLLLSASTVLTVAAGRFVFGIPVVFGVISVLIAAAASLIAVRSVGETDFNPIGALGKMGQFVFGAIAPGEQALNLMSAGVSASAVSQSADLMTDFKAGNILRVPAWKQVICQFVGVLFGVLMVVPAYKLMTRAFPLGGEQFPAPAGQLWKGVALLVTQGAGVLPQHAGVAILLAAALAVILSVLEKIVRLKPYVPSPMAIGLAFILSANFPLTIGLGAVVAWTLMRYSKSVTSGRMVSLASGMIAGEGLMMVVYAAVIAAGIS